MELHCQKSTIKPASQIKVILRGYLEDLPREINLSTEINDKKSNQSTKSHFHSIFNISV